MLDLGQYQIRGTTSREIAASAEAAIREGLLDAGDRLPTVRALAHSLGCSPATVNAAYATLRQRGLVVAEGRRGTRVAPRPALRRPEPARRRTTPAHDVLPTLPPHVRDLSAGLPDPALLPPIEPALGRIEVDSKIAVSGLEAADSRLLEVAAAWFDGDGVATDALAVASGAFDGIERVLQAHLRPGDRVIIEDPAYVSIRDLLLAIGLIAVPVPVDEFGLLPEPLEHAVVRGADAILIVPRAQNPYGSAMNAERQATLQAVIDHDRDLLVVEDDHAGIVSGAPFSTLVTGARRRWAIIRSVSKFLHPDLRLALMAGDALTIDRVEGRQAIGPRWVSHLLQTVVAEQMSDPTFPVTTAAAREAYALRRTALIESLARHGVAANGRSGLNVWVPVREEAPTVRALLDAGWFVLAGERFRIASTPGIRITTSTLGEDEAAELAAMIAGIAHAGRPRQVY